MIKNVLSNIGGVGLYGVVSICLFFTVFIGAMLWAFAHGRDHLGRMSLMPLDDQERTNLQTKGDSHE